MTQIYVGNIPFTQTEEELRRLFEQYGQVTSVNMINDRETGRQRGFGFVEMPNDDEADEAIKKLENYEIDGRHICVNEARPKEPRPPRDTW
ncbi:MAG: RNA-binding protein [Campylobacterota bacterium]|nr:RNA-binding protein [Campylobacterota bacterium]